MDDFEGELNYNNKDQSRLAKNLGQFSDPYCCANLPKTALNHSSRSGGVTFQIEEEDDFMCPYEQTQATNYFNYDMKNRQQQSNRLDEDALSDIFSDDCYETEAGSPPVNMTSQHFDQKFLGVNRAKRGQQKSNFASIKLN